MARTRERLAVAQKALGTLQTLLTTEAASDVVRDAAFQRFEYSFEATWKAAQVYLSEVEGLEVASPRTVIRASLEVGVLDETATRRVLKMVDDCNPSVHTYNEGLDEAIFARLGEHAQVLAMWLGVMGRRASKLGTMTTVPLKEAEERLEELLEGARSWCGSRTGGRCGSRLSQLNRPIQFLVVAKAGLAI